ncbi:hypothetical protein EB72_24695 [Mycobacterium sp. SWH-M1]|nr:hypothetical protein EB72_24695 [Mycobacterium sp. SWH-M1]
MQKVSHQDPLPLPLLLPDWRRSLRAENKSPQTVEQYTIAARLFIRFAEQNGYDPVLDRQLVRLFIEDRLATCAESTAQLRFVALKQFANWLVREGEIDENPLLGMRGVSVPEKIVHGLTDQQLKALVDACRGKDFRDLRDNAAIRLLAECGMRCGELLRVTVADIDLDRHELTIPLTKTKRGRVSAFGDQTADHVSRYLRARRRHRRADLPTLLLSDSNRPTFAYAGLRGAIMRRAEMAGINDFHLHLLRNTAATRWRARGGSEEGAMVQFGWRSPTMLRRYTAATANQRAIAEAQALNLGNI